MTLQALVDRYAGITPPDLAARHEGAMLGLAVGNLLGVPVEFDTKARLAARYPDGLREIASSLRDEPWGDDLAQAIVLAEAIVEDGEPGARHAGSTRPAMAGRERSWDRGAHRGGSPQTARGDATIRRSAHRVGRIGAPERGKRRGDALCSRPRCDGGRSRFMARRRVSRQSLELDASVW
ncbi:MAG: ADP-ribosylglycohydrolase family protein [Actinomycetota bacterium]